MRRALTPWLIAFGVAVLVAAGAVITLNATVFGPGAFVQIYLDALARGDVSDALSLPGVDPGAEAGAGGRSAALLHDGTLSGLSDIHQTGDESRAGAHWITVDWTSPHGSGTTTFQVQRIGTRFGLFPEWGFAASPVATVSLAVEHDPRFTVNGADELSTTGSSAPTDYTVLVPGAYVFAHSSRYLSAAPELVLADTVGQTIAARVDTQANARLLGQVSSDVNEQLRSCTTQAVLFPTGCPYGQAIDNRVSSAPQWSLVALPQIRIVPGEEFGSWAIPPTPGTAHLVVKVTSLLNGSVSEFNQDVPFRVAATVTLDAEDDVRVTLR